MTERADPRDSGFREGSIYREKLFERYNFCNKYIKDKIVLDIPCGVGWGTSLLKGAKKIYGVDISQEAIDYGQKHYKDIKFKIGNMVDIPFENNHFDIVICLEGYEHISRESQSDFLKEAKRVLKKKGLIIITTPLLGENGRSTGNPYHIHEPSWKEANAVFLSNFKKCSCEIISGPDSKELKFIGKK